VRIKSQVMSSRGGGFVRVLIVLGFAWWPGLLGLCVRVRRLLSARVPGEGDSSNGGGRCGVRTGRTPRGGGGDVHAAEACGVSSGERKKNSRDD